MDTESSKSAEQANSALAGRAAIVTGASKGIGRSIALALAAAGARVSVAARGSGPLDELVDEIREAGGEAIAVPADVTEYAQVEDLIARTVDAFDTVDIMVNNAGVVPFLAPFHEIKLSGFEKYFNANLLGAVYGMKAVAPVLLEKGDGCVLNIASISGFLASPALSYYASAKAAIINLTETVAYEWAPFRVRVNAIAPGHIATEMNEDARESSPQFDADVTSATALGRWGQTSEVANAAVFLCSPAASFITGAVLRVDGGEALSNLAGLVAPRRLEGIAAAEASKGLAR